LCHWDTVNWQVQCNLGGTRTDQVGRVLVDARVFMATAILVGHCLHRLLGMELQVLGVSVAMARHKAGRNVLIGCAQAIEIVAKGSMVEVGNGQWVH